jgi:hypothetical protein
MGTNEVASAKTSPRVSLDAGTWHRGEHSDYAGRS